MSQIETSPELSFPELSFEDKVDAARALVEEQIVQAPAGEICVTTSFQAEDVLVLSLVRAKLPGVPVVFLDTGYHFAETYEYRDRIAREWNLNLVNLLPEQTVAEQEAQFGILHQTDPSRCCGLRKVAPLFKELEKYQVWLTGMRREQAKSRAQLQAVDHFTLPSGKQLLKISPLADWSAKDVWTYAGQQGIPLLPLYDQGYTSIGCAPCTSLPFDPGDPRSGRWGGRKQECGIHIQPS
ncbi:MAG TPA: phosphoadenylyl-sulfate reductase [Acidobacteriaceae bacterium]|nr:phosphoadenylyl-sulfate reductase [Acidobacteriaceae bacterium]